MTLRVLVVDDATFVRDTIKRNLREFIPDLECIEAVDGKRAISAMKVGQIDMILSDWEMPEMTGEELLRWVRAQPKFLDTPFIMVTSRGEREHVVLALHAGVSDYLTKPFTSDELRRKVEKQLTKISYKPPGSASLAAKTSGLGSLDVLTGAKPAAAPPPRSVERNGGLGRAQLHFSDRSCECTLSEFSLQAMSGQIARGDRPPTLFDRASVDIEGPAGERVEGLSIFIQGLQAVDPRPDADTIKVSARFVDCDPATLERLARLITR